jgi:hypothetical protein
MNSDRCGAQNRRHVINWSTVDHHQTDHCDRDNKWTDGFRRLIEGAGVRVVQTPLQAPNAKA